MKYIVKFTWGTYLYSHCAAVISGKDVNEAKRFDNKTQIARFRKFWNYSKESCEIIPIEA